MEPGSHLLLLLLHVALLAQGDTKNPLLDDKLELIGLAVAMAVLLTVSQIFYSLFNLTELPYT